MTITQPRFGASLRAHRLAKGRSIGKAALRIGIAKGNLSRIERGADLQIATLRKIAKAYGLRVTIS